MSNRDFELRTIEAMCRLYCRAHHSPSAPGGPGMPGKEDGLCQDCRELFNYAREKLEKCAFLVQGLEKPACAKCPIHCYQPEYRERVRIMMRYSGPRMLKAHPWLALRHLLDSWLSGVRIRKWRKVRLKKKA